jgi:hypothetical protein
MGTGTGLMTGLQVLPALHLVLEALVIDVVGTAHRRQFVEQAGGTRFVGGVQRREEQDAHRFVLQHLEALFARLFARQQRKLPRLGVGTALPVQVGGDLLARQDAQAWADLRCVQQGLHLAGQPERLVPTLAALQATQQRDRHRQLLVGRTVAG